VIDSSWRMALRYVLAAATRRTMLSMLQLTIQLVPGERRTGSKYRLEQDTQALSILLQMRSTNCHASPAGTPLPGR
jgi:hypothetical protein